MFRLLQSFLMPHQWLCGFGELTVQNLVTNENGWVSPGLSPGTLTINGNYGQRPGGKLLIELGGTNPADCDHLVITNQATLDGNVTLRFINGFAPKTGDQFDFLDVGGGITGAFASLGLQNLAPGFQFELTTNGPLQRMALSSSSCRWRRRPSRNGDSKTNANCALFQ